MILLVTCVNYAYEWIKWWMCVCVNQDAWMIKCKCVLDMQYAPLVVKLTVWLLKVKHTQSKPHGKMWLNGQEMC
jgi:hypothetical protein